MNIHDRQPMSDDRQDEPQGDRELHELLAAVCDETLTAEQAERLADRLRREPAARRFYVRYLDMHARLLGLPGLAADSQPRRGPDDVVVPTAGLRWIASMAVPLAAASVTLLAIALLLRRPPGDREPPVGVAAVAATPPVVADLPAKAGCYVATITVASPDARLGGRRAVVGGRLLPAAWDVTDGSIAVRFDGGAEIFFDTGSRFRITSRRSLEVEEGAFVFQGDATCEPLTITTPQATLVDVGTRYAAVVKPGAEELHVLDGAVRRSTGGPEEFVTAGAGRAYDDRAPQGRVIPIDAGLVQRSAEADTTKPIVAAPDAADDFRATAESIDGVAGGSGWRGGWIAHRGLPPFAIASPGLGPDGAGIVHHGGGSRAAHRVLEQPIDLGTDDVRYVRYLVRREADLPGDNNLAMLVLRKRGLTVEEELARQSFVQLAVCRDDTVALKFLGESVRSSAVLPPGTTMAVVAKVVSGREQPDQIFLRVMPAARLEDREPEAWTAVTASVATDLVFDQVSVEAVSRGTVWIDDIAVGPSWASIALPRKDEP
jgi:hypothetical protein